MPPLLQPRFIGYLLLLLSNISFIKIEGRHFSKQLVSTLPFPLFYAFIAIQYYCCIGLIMLSWHCHSSFNDKPVNEAAIGPIGKELFEKEQEDLLSDLKDIPKKACDRRVSFSIQLSPCYFPSFYFP